MSTLLRKLLLLTGGGAAPNPLASVPWVAQWKFNNNGNDSIGSNNLTNNNSATFTTGLLGGATGATVVVAASSQYWSHTSNATLQFGNTDWMIALWASRASNFGQGVLIRKFGSSQRELDLRHSSRVPTATLYDGTSTTVATVTWGTAVANDATWHLHVLWLNTAEGKLYLSIDNGTPVSGTVSGTPGVNSGSFLVGGDTGAYWDGAIDAVCFAKGAGAVPSQAILDALWNSGVGTETLT